MTTEMTPEPSFAKRCVFALLKAGLLRQGEGDGFQQVADSNNNVYLPAIQIIDDLHARENGKNWHDVSDLYEDIPTPAQPDEFDVHGKRKERWFETWNPTPAQPQGEWSKDDMLIRIRAAGNIADMAKDDAALLRAELAAVREELRRLKFAINMSCDYPVQKKIKELAKPSLECDRMEEHPAPDVDAIAREAWEQIRQVCEYNKFNPIIFDFDNGPTIIKDAINRALTCKHPRQAVSSSRV